MRSSIVAVGIVVLAAVVALGGTFNVTITDRNTKLLEWFTEVRLYAVDPQTDERLTDEPTVVLTDPKSPLELELEPGRYEFSVWMSWLPKEVHYFYFDVDEDHRTTIELRSYEIPEELIVR